MPGSTGSSRLHLLAGSHKTGPLDGGSGRMIDQCHLALYLAEADFAYRRRESNRGRPEDARFNRSR
jgi:hypothetical protein